MTDAAPLLAILLCAARLGGAIARAAFEAGGARMALHEKGARDYQTEADCAVERAIAAELAAALPGVAIVGKERWPTEPGRPASSG